MMRRAQEHATPDKINLERKFALFSEQWRPKVVAALNGQEIKLVKVQGTFPWHHHDAEDEFFLNVVDAAFTAPDGARV